MVFFHDTLAPSLLAITWELVWLESKYFAIAIVISVVVDSTIDACRSDYDDTILARLTHIPRSFLSEKVPEYSSQLLSTERKYQARFETITSFRRRPDQYPLQRALQEYYEEPVAYALALAELNTAVFNATRKRNWAAIMSLIELMSLDRKYRDVVGYTTYGSGALDTGMIVLSNMWHEMMYLWDRLHTIIDQFFPLKPQRLHVIGREGPSQSAWRLQLEDFVANVNFFCQHTGAEVDDLAMPRETINNLRKFASDRRQELAPLLEVNGRLNRKLTSYKRINAALQTRHTIEKLTFELPDTAQYDFPGSGPKWRVFWDQTWKDAKDNQNNPFHMLYTQATGEYNRNNIHDKGRSPFADMSGEIHGYGHGRQAAFDYEHFDISARQVAEILHQEPIMHQATGDVDWSQEIRKYPIVWPDADNLELTLLARLEGKVANLKDRLANAEAERDAEVQRLQDIQDGIAGGEASRQQREAERQANSEAQDRDFGLDIFG